MVKATEVPRHGQSTAIPSSAHSACPRAQMRGGGAPMSVYDREWAREDVRRRDALPHAPAFALGAPPRGREPSSPPAPPRRMGSVEGEPVAISGRGLLLTI